MRIAKIRSSLSLAEEKELGKENMGRLNEKVKILEEIFSRAFIVEGVSKRITEIDGEEIKVTTRECRRDCPLSLDDTGCICKDAISTGSTRQKLLISGKDAYFVISKPVNVGNGIYNVVIVDKLNAEFAFGTTDIGSAVKQITDISSSLVIDQLTRIYNRKFLDDNSGYWIESAIKNQIEMCLCSIDIDNFKRFNDSYGHDFGDKVLSTLARSMEEAIDGMTGTYPIRVGGDEFLIICTNGMYKKRFIGAMGKLCSIVQGKRLMYDNKPVGITISAGVGAVIEDGVSTYKELYESADKALYAAKKAGKNCVR